jgi:hypothetical protein
MFLSMLLGLTLEPLLKLEQTMELELLLEMLLLDVLLKELLLDFLLKLLLLKKFLTSLV